MKSIITLSHGAGGKDTNELIEEIFFDAFKNEYLTADDAAILPSFTGKLAFTTDGFIVSPWKFPGGNIGKLSVCGSVNDLAAMGAKPLYLSCAFVIEEGFPTAALKKIANSMKETAAEVGVKIVVGDTKVAGRGQIDGVFITTSGIGAVLSNANLSGKYAKAGDVVIITGDIGRHGATILLARDSFGIDAKIESDCAPLWEIAKNVLEVSAEIHTIRDATRGGVGTVLYEIAKSSNVGISLYREKIPVQNEIKGLTGMLGLEPLYLASEGRFVIIVDKNDAEKVLQTVKKSPYGENAAVIGEVTDEHKTKVTIKTEIGAETFLPAPGGELLPRIC
ncbi:MAG: hydrogenase expression/formation protein HypE [Selenomonadaceae bacterium]|nr:hydrogenase expression/formation protein HypE [Selenomonadaceae bacterium]MBP3723402.1 hydrogenase expression/formation protein HypE [Selenomonadaceae bacterium]